MKLALRGAFFALLLAASSAASAQRSVFVPSLPEGVDRQQALDVARQVLVAHGWTIVPADASSIEAEKEHAGLRIFVSDRALRFSDQSLRGRGVRQREHRDEGPALSAVPQAELDGLRADLLAAFAGKLPLAGSKPMKVPSELLLGGIPAGIEPEKVMQTARNAFAARRWEISADRDGAFIAHIRGNDAESTLRVFLADGALRFTDRTTDRKGQKAKVPERWMNYVRADLRQSLSLLAAREGRKSVARAAPPGESDPVERMKKLKAMLDGGLITQAEYDAKRAEILKGL